MTRTRVVVNTSLFFLVAVAFGVIEGSGHVKWGAPNFGPFVAEWHIPMAVLMLATAYLSDYPIHIPLWVLLEDMTYWVASRFIWNGPELTPDSWVSMSLGGFTVFGVYLPWMYVILFGLWGICIGVRWLYRCVCIMHE
jgi:hypothetical protein